MRPDQLTKGISPDWEFYCQNDWFINTKRDWKFSLQSFFVLEIFHSVKECPCSEIFWSVFSRICITYRDLQSKCPYSVRIRGMRTRTSPSADTFHAVLFFKDLDFVCIFMLIHHCSNRKLKQTSFDVDCLPMKKSYLGPLRLSFCLISV